MNKKSYILLLAASLALSAASANAEEAANGVRVTVGDLTDNRTTGQFFSGLQVELKVSGDAVFNATGIGKPVFTVAKDDTGRVLIKEEKADSLIWGMDSQQQHSANQTIKAELLNPARKATAVTLEGTIPVYAPALDPSAIVTLPDITAIYGRPMNSKETGVSLTVLDSSTREAYMQAKQAEEKAKATSASLGQAIIGGMFSHNSRALQNNQLEFHIKDPSKRLAKFEVVGADGKVIETQGRSYYQQNDESVYSYDFRSPITKGANLRLYYTTPKSLFNVPFRAENIPLP